ncbi:hydrogenase maturation protein [Thiolapillus sp.]
MRILLLVHAFNSLSQRLFVELRQAGHEISIEFDINDAVTEEAVRLFQPELILAPFLKRAIPESVWRRYCCLVVHPGIPGDRGPSALDWAILNQESHWGVTVLQANEIMDGGDIWASADFPMREATKASLYRHEVTEAAVGAVLQAVSRYASGDYRPIPMIQANTDHRGCERPMMRQRDRRINWDKDDTQTVLRKIRSADGAPGVLDEIAGRECYLYDAHPESTLTGFPGSLIARSEAAICRATTDGAVWIGHLCDRASEHPFKLPATRVLGDSVSFLPEVEGYQPIRYEERGPVGHLHFDFYNGAMSTEQCRGLLAAYRQALKRPTRVIVLQGGVDFWSNGMHLNIIEAADSTADESWANINAIDDLAQAIIETDSHLTVAALHGNAGAGGVFLARAADFVWAREGVILNPHYKDMGNLHGSEFWSYLLPRHAGEEGARSIMQTRLPMGIGEALTAGLVDERITGHFDAYYQRLDVKSQALAASGDFHEQLERKRWRRQVDEKSKSIQEYREEELARMYQNFYGFDPSYHVARYNFVYKVPKSRTPLTLAQHRRAS